LTTLVQPPDNADSDASRAALSAIIPGEQIMVVSEIDLLETIRTLPPHSTLLAHDVSWEEYQSLLAEMGDAAGVKLSYADKTLEIKLPSSRHEKLKSLFAHLLMALADELNQKLIGFGSATFTNPAAEKGAEPDDCYYVTHATAVVSKEELDLLVDPPPDLVIEVDITPPSLDKLPIYAALRVPEFWRHDGKTLHFYRLMGDEYRPVTHSGLFPFLDAATLTGFVEMGRREDLIQMQRAFRAWVRGASAEDR
jgi:Uma2 family endonuclease